MTSIAFVPLGFRGCLRTAYLCTIFHLYHHHHVESAAEKHRANGRADAIKIVYITRQRGPTTPVESWDISACGIFLSRVSPTPAPIGKGYVLSMANRHAAWVGGVCIRGRQKESSKYASYKREHILLSRKPSWVELSSAISDLEFNVTN